jgi:hypothetical protein
MRDGVLANTHASLTAAARGQCTPEWERGEPYRHRLVGAGWVGERFPPSNDQHPDKNFERITYFPNDAQSMQMSLKKKKKNNNNNTTSWK